MDLSYWKGVPRPERIALDGRYARLEPLDAARHGADLLASAQQPGAYDRFPYLLEDPSLKGSVIHPWLDQAAASASCM